MDKALAIVVTSYVKAGKKEEYLELIAPLVENTKKEPGCLFFDLFEDPDDSSALTLIEIFKDKAAHKWHLEQEYFRTYLEKITPLRDEHRDRKEYFHAF